MMRFPNTVRTLLIVAVVAISIHHSARAQTEAAADLASDHPPASRDAEPTVRFNFAGEEWLGVLQWFADASGANVDWQELPEDEFNLTTQRSYSITEAHDVINLHLLARGFTLLSSGDVLFLVKLDENLNPALIPRVTPEELDERGRYEYVKVSFPLDWMLAETAVQELEPMLSPYGTITSFTTTNRVEAMDAAVNLREIRDLLEQEQSDNSEQRLVEEFVLEHANATEVLGKLREILGLEAPLGRMSRDQMRAREQRFEFQAEMIKELGEKAPGLRKHQEADVYLVAHERKNSILANAAPDKIAVIRQAIQALDVDTGDRVRLDEVTTMKVYPLGGADADAVADILQDLRDIGELHPSARFSEDDDRQILFTYASLQDHLTIKSVMDQLAGSARTFRVIPLTLLKATYVANSISTLMSGEREDSRSRDDWRRRRRGGSESGWSGFRVEPDPPNNRLFLFATDAEFSQVEELLVKIGERSRTAERGRVRIVDVAMDSAEDADDALGQLRELWPSVGPNPLRIDIPGHRNETESGPVERDAADRGDAEETSDRQAASDRALGGVDSVASETFQSSQFSPQPDRDRSAAYASLISLQDPSRFPPSDDSQQAFREEPPVTIHQGRVRLLVDREGDFTYEEATVFADGLSFPTSVLPYRDGVLVTAAPDLWFLRDTDGDGRADDRRVLWTGFGTDQSQQLRANALHWGLDNYICGANGRSDGELRRADKPGAPEGHPLSIRTRDFRFDPDLDGVEAITGQSQFGQAHDDWGRRFFS